MLWLVGWSWDFYGQFLTKSLVNDGSSGSIICGRPQPLRFLTDLCSLFTTYIQPQKFTWNQKITCLKKKIIGVNCIKFSLLQPKTPAPHIHTDHSHWWTSSQDTWCHIIVDNLGRTHHHTLAFWQELLTPTTPPLKKKKSTCGIFLTDKQTKQTKNCWVPGPISHPWCPSRVPRKGLPLQRDSFSWMPKITGWWLRNPKANHLVGCIWNPDRK